MPFFLAGQTPTADDLNQLTTGRARLQMLTNQTIPTSTSTRIEFDTVAYDDSAMWDETNHQIVIPANMGGLYAITASACFDSDGTGRRACDIVSNHGRLVSNFQPGTAIGHARFPTATQYELAPGDTIWVNAYQDSGGNLDVLGSATNVTHLAIVRVQPL